MHGERLGNQEVQKTNQKIYGKCSVNSRKVLSLAISCRRRSFPWTATSSQTMLPGDGQQWRHVAVLPRCLDYIVWPRPRFPPSDSFVDRLSLAAQVATITICNVQGTQGTCVLLAPMRSIEVRMEQRRNERAGETRDPRENLLTNGIVRHDSHMRKSFGTRPARLLANSRLARKQLANPVTTRRGAAANEHIAEALVCRGLMSLAYRLILLRNLLKQLRMNLKPVVEHDVRSAVRTDSHQNVSGTRLCSPLSSWTAGNDLTSISHPADSLLSPPLLTSHARPTQHLAIGGNGVTVRVLARRLECSWWRSALTAQRELDKMECCRSILGCGGAPRRACKSLCSCYSYIASAAAAGHGDSTPDIGQRKTASERLSSSGQRTEKSWRWVNGVRFLVPGRVAPGFSHVGIVPDDATVWRVFSGISRFPTPSFRRCSILTSLRPHGSKTLKSAAKLIFFS
ncbi:hypothetical protein PR048_023947 [Dryococelus australis]|uniref:Uncharacterized protein n=1 Tax=Dryococelus australis TaxID=614101 RepID=A0ABQ9GVP3_9NEOP|nr:hypothetical protein PR048_023947 [Dryococelus australis]